MALLLNAIALLDATPPGRIFGLDEQTLYSVGITLFNISFLAFVLSYLLYKPVREFLLKRTIRIREQLRDAEREQREAGELRASLEERLKDIEREKLQILDNARKDASEKARKQIAEARAEAEEIKERAFHEIKLEQERVKDELNKIVIDISAAMTTKLLSRTVNSETHESLFNEALSELEAMAWHS